MSDSNWPEESSTQYCTCDMPDGAGYCAVHEGGHHADLYVEESDIREDMTDDQLRSAWSRGELVVAPGVVAQSTAVSPDLLTGGGKSILTPSLEVSPRDVDLDDVIDIPFEGSVIMYMNKRQIRHMIQTACNKTGKDIFTLLDEAGLR